VRFSSGGNDDLIQGAQHESLRGEARRIADGVNGFLVDQQSRGQNLERVRQLEILALRSLELASPVVAGEMAFLDAVDVAYEAAVWSGLIDTDRRRHSSDEPSCGFRQCAEANVTELRPYQNDVAADLEHTVASGLKLSIVVVPTGGGKSVIEFRKTAS
jgi:hypothetical protein